jgi:hypothetical protein
MTTTPAQPSLLEGLETIGASNAPAPKQPNILRRKWTAISADPTRKARFIKNARISSGILAAALAIGAYFLFRPMPKPDYDKDKINTVFKYTLLTDEFNRLPVEERMKLLGQLVSRLKSMSGGESALMAAFAAGIGGAARDQLERNASRLMIDVWDKHAVTYVDVKEEDKDAYLDQTMIEMMKMAEALGGRVRDIPDEQRLKEVNNQIERDRKHLSDPKNMPTAREFGRIFTMMDSNVGSHASAIQRVRGAQLMRDMGRHLRKEDLSTGKPRGGG